MNKEDRYIVIMAGGVGSRFWPSSTEEQPKQFLDIAETGKSLLQMTYDRCLQLVASDHVLIVTNKRYRDLIHAQLPSVPALNILCEPTRNNTAPCIAYAALRLQAVNENAVFAVLPSDHIIAKEADYISCLEEAFSFAAQNKAIVTLGIEPTRPDTGYGYIELDQDQDAQGRVRPVAAFKEKPDAATATTFLEDGNYVWNAGMFVWSVKTLIRSFESNAPEVLHPLLRDTSRYATETEQDYIDEVYPLTPSISVDYAILEKAANVYCLPCDIGWSDLGTWASLHDYLVQDDAGNVAFGREKGIEQVSNSLIKLPAGKKAIIRGLDGYMVVDTGEALLIYPMEEEQELKQSMEKLR